MPVIEVLRAIVFLHRKIDDKDFNEVVNCIPDGRMKELEDGLKARREAGEIDTIQIARHRKEVHPLSTEVDRVDEFFEKIDSKRLSSSMDRILESESSDGSPILP